MRRSARAPLLAGGGYLLAVAVSLLVWHAIDAARSARAVREYGALAAAEAAQFAAEPLARADSVALGVAAGRLAARPETLGIAIYAMDDRPAAVLGRLPPGAPIFVEEAVLHGAVAGYARVAVDAARFRFSVWQLLAASWPFHLLGLALAAGAAYGAAAHAARRRMTPRRQPADAGDLSATDAQTFVLVANLFHATAAHRDAIIRRGLAAAEQVAGLYAGRALPLPGTGFALALPAAAADARGFDAACAALLTRRLCERGGAAAQDGTVPPARFRYGLDLVESGARLGAEAPVLRPVALLASLAPDGRMAISAAALARIGDEGCADRLRIAEFDSPSAAVLAGAMTPPAGFLDGANARQEALLAQQARSIGRNARADSTCGRT